MPHKTGIRLIGVAQNPANGFPARLLGASLFLELLEKLGTDEFNKRIQELHRVYEAASKVGSYPVEEAYKYTDIHGLRQVFHDQIEIVERHWSGRMDAPENRP